jgi:uncharacterized protein (DUF2147 family)
MRSNDEGRSSELTDDAVNRLFERFSLPMVQACVTASQKQSAVGIAKVLWLRLVSGADTDEKISEDLRRAVGNKHDAIVALGSTYFFKMKTGLTEAEIDRLKDYYSDDRNFRRLEQ